ncbi:MAG TPA: DUF5691 domain-containing protein, partial [Flavisolibacter sp.]|nr:DUF5691 domain-containing protein [Flavisolibacter sp.]
GAWLVAFNEAWKYTAVQEEEELWQTGTLEQRKTVLATVRTEDPAKGLLLLQQVWSSENAATRAELVQQLETRLSHEDLPWLEEQLQEKSTKVKAVIIDLMKRIPSSSIVQLYWRLLQPSIEVRTEKKLLGLTSKTVIELTPIKEVDETIFKTGLEKVSSEKKVSDDVFLLYQLIMSVPPSFLEAHTGLEKAALLKALQQEEVWLPALAQGAIQFKEVDWLRVIIAQDSTRFYADALSLLPQAEAEAYALQHSDNVDHLPDIIQQLIEREAEWGLEITRSIFRFTADNPYQYSRSFYNGIVHLIPVAIASELEQMAPEQSYTKSMWNSLSEYITRLLTLKSETRKAFNE